MSRAKDYQQHAWSRSQECIEEPTDERDGPPPQNKLYIGKQLIIYDINKQNI
jgi:hypothetical protein